MSRTLIRRSRAATAVLGLAGMLAATALGSAASAGGTLPDAGNLSSKVTGQLSSKPIPAVWTLAQTFVAEHSGRVAAATAVLSTVNATCVVRYRITDVTASGKPKTDLGATGYSSVSGDQVVKRLTFADADAPSVVAGTKYGLLVQVEQQAGNGQCASTNLSWATTSTDYASGASYNIYPVDIIEGWEGPREDAVFGVEVTVPDPVVTAPLNVQGGEIGFGAAPGAPTISGVTLDGGNKTATGSLPLLVSDARGTGAGWNVQIAATPFTNSAGKALPGSAVTFTSPAAGVCAAGVDCAPAVNSTLTGILGASATRVFAAAADSGMGNQTITPGFSIALPAKAYKGNYSSTWVVSLVTGP